MNKDFNLLSTVVAAIVIVCWWLLAVMFFTRKKHPKAPTLKRDRLSLFGAALAVIGHSLVWFIRRPLFTPLIDFGPWIDWTVALLAIVLAISSVWLIVSVARSSLEYHGTIDR